LGLYKLDKIFLKQIAHAGLLFTLSFDCISFPEKTKAKKVPELTG
jgi:hypothetical protein